MFPPIPEDTYRAKRERIIARIEEIMQRRGLTRVEGTNGVLYESPDYMAKDGESKYAKKLAEPRRAVTLFYQWSLPTPSYASLQGPFVKIGSEVNLFDRDISFAFLVTTIQNTQLTVEEIERYLDSVAKKYSEVNRNRLYIGTETNYWTLDWDKIE